MCAMICDPKACFVFPRILSHSRLMDCSIHPLDHRVYDALVNSIIRLRVTIASSFAWVVHGKLERAITNTHVHEHKDTDLMLFPTLKPTLSRAHPQTIKL